MRRHAPEKVTFQQQQQPNEASQIREAFASMDSKTGSNSPGELEMTLSTSLVAVWRSSDSGDRRALAQFVEESSVLDGDHGLSGEVRHQCNLLVGKRPDLLAVDDECAHKTAVLPHGHGEQRARPAKSGCDPGERLRQLVGG